VNSVINRYYDPTTDQFLSIDPFVSATHQPYLYTNEDPLNTEDPDGLRPVGSSAEMKAPALEVRSYAPVETDAHIFDGIPVETYSPKPLTFGEPGGVTVTVSVSLTVSGPNSLTMVSVSNDGNITISAGSSSGNFSTGGSVSTDPSADGYTYSYTSTQTLGQGSNADTVTANGSYTVSYQPGSGASGRNEFDAAAIGVAVRRVGYEIFSTLNDIGETCAEVGC
jgi:hypothetical protein